MSNKTFYKVEYKNKKYSICDLTNNIENCNKKFSYYILKKAFSQNKIICVDDTGEYLIEEDVYKSLVSQPINNDLETSYTEQDHFEIVKFIKESYSLKPEGLFMNELKWKTLIRSVIRGKNILLLGPTGSGKTSAAKVVGEVLKRPFFYFNLGSTQDPRTFLIGNTQFKKDTGTVFNESLFIKAIKTKNSVILLDELSRAHPDAWNILMTVLDDIQRYVRLDEKDDYETVSVEEGVTFIATANVGTQYTATRTLDKALFDRFSTLEMDCLTQEEELSLLKFKYPQANETLLKHITEITSHTREVVVKDGARISNCLSTRQSVEMAGLVYDGFSLVEIAESMIYPSFSDDGGAESERVYMKQFVQKYISVDNKSAADGLFNVKINDSDKVPF
jgi:MoxR-like ATPase